MQYVSKAFKRRQYASVIRKSCGNYTKHSFNTDVYSFMLFWSAFRLDIQALFHNCRLILGKAWRKVFSVQGWSLFLNNSGPGICFQVCEPSSMHKTFPVWTAVWSISSSNPKTMFSNNYISITHPEDIWKRSLFACGTRRD